MKKGRISKDEKFQRTVGGISLVSCLTVSGLAMASFTLSFDALRSLAVTQEVVKENLAWIYPLVIDGGIVVFSLSALRSSLRGESAAFNRSLVIAVTLLSVVLNIAHVKQELLAMVLAATPPLLLFLSFEALMHTVRAEMVRERDKPEVVLEEKPLNKEERCTLVKRHLAEGMNAHEIVEIMPSVSLRTIQRDIAKLESEKTD